ncbi:hypothetical protein ILUMI_18875 [Ignelater luminosus]|uniref:Uncharacterized protein n=1 Tax=Ignelater luminosus TaxID=2038154 RepID=A0A8K0CMR9_IGNLU|nr:hypothetical protein ILUMI_18875 [Ignelater luminosus]
MTFHLWKMVHNEINLHKEDNLSDSLSEPPNQPDEYINVQNEINHNLDETQSPDTDVRVKSIDKIIAEQSTPPVTPGPSNKVVGVQDIVVKPAEKPPETNTSSSVNSPFKSALFRPRQITPETRRRTKDKIPSVATSEQWWKYHQKKQEDKERKEKVKEERKAKREERRD